MSNQFCTNLNTKSLICFNQDIAVLATWMILPYTALLPIVVAFITSGIVGIYMMVMTKDVAQRLHDHIDEQISVSREIKSSIDEMKTDTKEMKTDMKEMKTDMKEMKTDMKSVATTLYDMKGILQNIEKKI